MTAERENVGRRLRGLVEIARTQDVEDGNGLADRAWLFATASDVSDFVAALDARLAAAETALADVGNLSDEWEHSAELEVGRRQDDSNAKVAVYRICARELRAAVLVSEPAAEEPT